MKNKTKLNLLNSAGIYIRDMVQQNPENRMPDVDMETIFEAPLLGVADGYDPLFDQYKEIIGPYHKTPEEIILEIYDDIDETQGLSVLCWALPFSASIRKSNYRKSTIPSYRWCRGTEDGERFNNLLRKNLEVFFKGKGIKAVAAVSSSAWKRIEDLPGGHTSNWSERHALYAAGMGTFSLSDGFITDKGMAMRCGSIIVNADLPKSERMYQSHVENCLFHAKGLCKKCIDRCPAGAISGNGHDKVLCRTFREKFFGEFLHDKCGMDIEPGMCGLCQTNVPCESTNPMAASKKA